jgi:hypothetical protein
MNLYYTIAFCDTIFLFLGCGVFIEARQDTSMIISVSMMNQESSEYRLARYDYWGEGIFDVPLPDHLREQGILQWAAEHPVEAAIIVATGKKILDWTVNDLVPAAREAAAKEFSMPSSPSRNSSSKPISLERTKTQSSSSVKSSQPSSSSITTETTRSSSSGGDTYTAHATMAVEKNASIYIKLAVH